MERSGNSWGRSGADNHSLIQQERARYLETFYHRHPGDPHLYDLVLNTGILDLESAVDVIAIVLKRKARRLSVPMQELGPAVGLSHYPGRPEDFRPQH